MRFATPATLVLVLTAVLFVVTRVILAPLPLERDEGEYAYAAQRMLHGDAPYRDVFDQKPPGVFFAYLPAVAIFGTSVIAIHVTLYVVNLVGLVFLWLLARRISSERAAAFTALIYAALTTELYWSATAANTEQFLLTPLVAGVWCAFKAPESARRAFWWLAAGALGMASAWFKPIAVVAAPLFVGLWFAHLRQRRAAAKDLGALVLGGVIISIPPIVYMLATGSFAAFLDAVIVHNSRYAGSTSLADGWTILLRALREQAVALWLAWALTVAGIFLKSAEARGTTTLLTVWLIIGAIGTAIGMRFYPHYFLFMAPPMALLMARALDWCADQLTSGGFGIALMLIAIGVAAARAVSWTMGLPIAFVGVFALIGTALRKNPLPIVLGLAVAGISPSYIAARDFWLKMDQQMKVQALYPENPFDVAQTYAKYIDAHSASLDTVLIHGSEPEILFYANRKSATRYIIFYPLNLPVEGVEDRQIEAWQEIQDHQPRFILMTEVEASLLEQTGTPRFIREHIAGMLVGYRLVMARVFQGEEFRLAFGEDAEQAYQKSRQPHSPIRVDMLLFQRK